MSMTRWLRGAHKAYSEHLSDIRYVEISNEFYLIEFDLQLETATAYKASFWYPSVRMVLEEDIPMRDIEIQQHENELYFTFPSGREVEITIQSAEE